MIDSIKQLIVKWLKRRGYHLFARGYLNQNVLDLLLHELLEKRGKLFFIQIGANDGVSFDPIYEFVTANHQSISGIVIEPVKDDFEKLCNNYRTYPNITPVNKAIHNTEREMPIYRVHPDHLADYPGWVNGVASFDRDKLVNSDGIDPEAIIEEKVTCVSLNQLVDDLQAGPPDFLQIDTEGYDYEIISGLDFSQISPALIHFEHGVPKNIMSRENLEKLRKLLHHHGYELWVMEWDAIAYKTDVFV